MNDRWRVEHGTFGAWRVYRGEERIAAFWSWRRANQYARQEAVLENLSIISLEICS